MIAWFKDFFKFSNMIVFLVISMNMWFTERCLDAFVLTGNEPGILIGAFFAFTTGELWMLASITKTKVKKDINVRKLNRIVRFSKRHISNLKGE